MYSNLNITALNIYITSLVIGFCIVLSGMFFLGSGPYKTFIYGSFVVPTAFFIMLNWRQIVFDYTRGAVLWVFLALLFTALSALWGSGDVDIVKAIRRCLLYWVSGFGIFYLYHYQRKLFVAALVLSGFISSVMTLLWLVDYYYLIDHQLGQRFMSKTMDYFDLYSGRGYGALYNPLLFSHLLVFNLVVALMLFASDWPLSRIQKVLLIVSSSVFIVALLASQTRMALGLFSFICAYSLVWHYKLKGLAIVVAGFVSMVVLLLTVGDALLERGLSYRLDIWSAMIAQVAERPLLGYGYGTDVVVSPKGVGHTWYDTHNIYLAILYYSGYIGLSLILLAFAMLFRESKKLSSGRYLFNLWMIILVFGGFTDGDGLLSRPSEHWFNLVLPCLLMIAIVRSDALNRASELKPVTN